MGKIKIKNAAMALLGLAISVNTHAGSMGAATAGIDDSLSLVVKGAWAGETRAQFNSIDAFGVPLTTDNLRINGNYPFSTDLYNDSSRYDSFSPGVELWLPLQTIDSNTFNGILFTDYIAGPSSTFNANYTSAGSAIQDITTIKTSRMNYGVGFNLIHNFDEQWFVEGMLGGGITNYSGKAEWIQRSISTANVVTVTTAADHPGASATTPFFQAEIGAGRQVTNKSRVFVFVSGAWAANTNPFTFVNMAGATACDISVNAPSRWVKAGIGLTRALNI